MVLKSLLKELMSAKGKRKSYKHKYWEVRGNVTSTDATPVTKGEAVVTNPIPAITTTTVASALRKLRQLKQ